METPGSLKASRNDGRSRACGPCHRRKVACDRSRPTCGSCNRRRRRKESCEYENGPLLQQEIRRPAIPGHHRSDDNSTPASLQTPITQAISPAAREIDLAEDATSSNDDNLPHQALNQADKQVSTLGSPPRPGYLGVTSFLGIYEEARDNVALPAPQSCSRMRCHDRLSSTADQQPIILSNETLETCREIVRNVPRRHDANALLDAHFGPHSAWIQPLAQRMLDSFYDNFEGFLSSDDSTEQQLDLLSQLLAKNTAKPFSEDEHDAHLWTDQFSGPNFRWESLGILFVYWELGSRKGCPVGGELDSSTRKNATYRKCVDDCLSQARAATTTGNILLVYLYYKRMIISSVSSGDATLACWEFHAETVAAMTFLGFHVENEPQAGHCGPNLASEFRRRLFCFIFNSDKSLASFTGRPPLLSRRYVSTRLPLDLSDDWLLADGETLRRRISELDENGWSQDDIIYPVSNLRARFILAIIRDEVLEIALAMNEKISRQSLYNLKARQIETLAKLPHKLRFDAANFSDLTVGAETLYIRLLLHLQHLQNLFLIERLLCRVGYAENESLLQVSFEMVSTAVMFWTNMDRLSVISHDFMWLVMDFAVPGGGVLCLKLLEPVGAGSQQSTGISRSAIVQQLSLLAGFLGWVKPYASNGDLCANCKVVIQAVLDHSLNYPNDTLLLPPDIEDWGLSGQLDFDLDLMDTFEWLRPEFS